MIDVSNSSTVCASCLLIAALLAPRRPPDVVVCSRRSCCNACSTSVDTLIFRFDPERKSAFENDRRPNGELPAPRRFCLESVTFAGPDGPEDLYYDPILERLWSHTEDEGDRNVYFSDMDSLN